LSKTWTPKEEEYIEENWGKKTFEQMAKCLNRSANAVETHGRKILGLGSTKDAQGLINAHQLAKACGVDIHAVTDYWIGKLGLKAIKKATRNKFEFWRIDIKIFWKWAKENKSVINFSKIEKNSLVPEPDWVDFERKKDFKEIPKKSNKHWTPSEDMQLINLVKSGNKTYKEIGEIMNRPIAGCEHRYSKLAKQNKTKLRKVQLLWNTTETGMMLDMEKQGFSDEEIAFKLGREADHIRDHRRNLREKGLYQGYKYNIRIQLIF
jgi:DNA-binding CsgD family transcriptional regulator